MPDEMPFTQQQSDAVLASPQSLKFIINNQDLSKALRMLSGVVDHSQVIQILSFIKCSLEKDSMLMIASNSEIEMHVRIPIESANITTPVSFTLPCRKLLDISRTLPKDAQLQCQQKESSNSRGGVRQFR